MQLGEKCQNITSLDNDEERRERIRRNTESSGTACTHTIDELSWMRIRFYFLLISTPSENHCVCWPVNGIAIVNSTEIPLRRNLKMEKQLRRGNQRPQASLSKKTNEAPMHMVHACVFNPKNCSQFFRKIQHNYILKY